MIIIVTFKNLITLERQDYTIGNEDDNHILHAPKHINTIYRHYNL